jgi:hypothetical protein
MQPGTRYWTVLKYFSLLYLVYTVVGVILNWESHRTAIVLPALFALALWRPRPIGWLFLLASLGIATFSFARPAILGLGYVGKVQVVGWGTPYDEELLRAQDAVLAVAALLTAMYLAKRKTLFVPSDTRLLWLRGIGAVVLALLILALPRLEQALDPGWGPRDMQRYVRAFQMQEIPKAANPHVNDPQSSTVTQSGQDQSSRPKPNRAKDINVWTYTPEFAARFGKPALSEPSPTGAYAVAFQVKWIEELDQCVFDAYLNNQLSIAYPEGGVGVTPFAYPASVAFLKVSPVDRQAVENAYLKKYSEPAAFIQTQAKGGKEPLRFLKYRRHLYADITYLSFTLPCNRVPGLGVSRAELKIRTTSGGIHRVELSKLFLERVQRNLTERRRKDAALVADNLKDINVWTYTPEFAQRFGLPTLNEPGPTGAQAVAYRVERNFTDPNVGDLCVLDLYIEDTVPLILPEGETGFSWSYPDSPWYTAPPYGTPDRQYWSKYLELYRKPGHTEWLVTKELKTLLDRWTYRNSKRLEGSYVRTGYQTPVNFLVHRKHALPRYAFITLNVGCGSASRGERGESEVRIEKADGTKHRILLPKTFLIRWYEYWREKHAIPQEIRLFGKPLEPQK